MSNDIALFMGGTAQLPAHLSGVSTGVSEALKAGIFAGGNRISVKGNRFRLIVNGKEEAVFEENYLDVIILGAAPAVSRTYYAKQYVAGENAAPDCYSADGVEPAKDVKNKQADKCALCPMNVRGSKSEGGNKYKACGYFRRLVVMLGGDTEVRSVYKLDIKSQSLWGEGKKVNNMDAYGLNEFIKAVDNRGIDIGMVVTRLSFDTDSSTPKLLFRPSRFVTPEELAAVQDLVGSDEVKKLTEVTMATVDSSGEESGRTPEGQQEAEEAAPAPKPTPTAQKPMQRPTPVQAKPVQQKPVKVEDSEPVPQRAASTPAKPQAKPAVVVEVDDADELADILAGLE